MEIWLIIDGEKRGPLADYEVRGMIQRGEVDGGVLAWQQGMDGWREVSSLPMFAGEFVPPGPKDEPVPAPPPLPVGRATLWLRRFWARWFDLQWYVSMWWLVIDMAGADIKGVFLNPWLLFLIYLPWVPIESIWIARFGTTPGKWIMGLRVHNDDGSALDGRQSVRRALRVYVLGIGLGWSFVSPLCQLLSWFHLRAMGKTLWDLRGGHRVTGKPWRWWRLPLYLLSGLLALQIQASVLGPHQAEMLEEIGKKMPRMREFLESWMPPEK